ncbi:thioredoxin-like protein [Tribonema minus]|uniref:Thioredoxin-like protein n=1 Tax=Tribonema minus TaxID=303371 RepID=A0A835ZLD9_9STRA|nr:thioredoxin-like protein [Tribonema minus]
MTRLSCIVFTVLLAALATVCQAFVIAPLNLARSRSSASSAVALHAKKAQYRNFEHMIEDIPVPLLLDMYAVWCGPCQMLAPELEKLGASMKGELQVAKVDSDKYPALASKLRVQGLPTCILFKDGKELMRMEGFRPAADMESAIKQALSQHASASSA